MAIVAQLVRCFFFVLLVTLSWRIYTDVHYMRKCLHLRGFWYRYLGNLDLIWRSGRAKGMEFSICRGLESRTRRSWKGEFNYQRGRSSTNST